MAFVFHVRQSREDIVLNFSRASSVDGFLKPTEVGIVSEPFPFELECGVKYGQWAGFTNAFRQLLIQKESALSELVSKESFGKCEIRMAICSLGPLKLEESDSEEDAPILVEPQPGGFVNVPVKVKLLSNYSNIPLSNSYGRKMSCLTQLVKVCEPENVSLEAEVLSKQTNNKVSFQQPRLQFSWNKEDLIWETQANVMVEKSEAANFGVKDIDFQISVVKVDFVLNTDGLKDVLDFLYRDHKDNTMFYMISGKLQSEVSNRAWLGMSNFICNGKCDMIWSSEVDYFVQLLAASERYQLPNLLQVTLFILLIRMKEKYWLNENAAVKLFNFVRKRDWIVRDELLKGLAQFLEGSKCIRFKELYHTAKQLGPVFISALGVPVEEKMEEMLPVYPLKEISKEQADLMLDWLRVCSVGGTEPMSLGIVLGIMLLSEQACKQVPDFTDQISQMFSEVPYDFFEVDYLMDLFCMVCDKEEELWKEIRVGTVFKLKKYALCQPQTVRGSSKFGEMFTTKAAQEFAMMIALGACPLGPEVTADSSNSSETESSDTEQYIVKPIPNTTLTDPEVTVDSNSSETESSDTEQCIVKPIPNTTLSDPDVSF